MLAATGALALLQRGWWWAVALGSGALWLAYQFAPTAVQIPWPIADNPVFPFASWQIVFFSGLILGYHQRRLAEWLHTRVPPSPLGDGYVLPLGAAVGALIWLSQTNAAAFNRFAPQRNAAAVLDARSPRA